MKARVARNAARGGPRRDLAGAPQSGNALQRRARARAAQPLAPRSRCRAASAPPHTQAKRRRRNHSLSQFERAQAKSTMFEATLQKASTLKKVIKAIKDLVTDGNI